jgi:hypothetical protein
MNRSIHQVRSRKLFINLRIKKNKGYIKINEIHKIICLIQQQTLLSKKIVLIH